MENEYMSSSDISTDSSVNNEFLSNTERQCKQLSETEHREKDKTDPDLVLNLRNVPPIYDPNSENDDSLEKLSKVPEHTEDLSFPAENDQSSQNDEDNYVLRERIVSLGKIMLELKEDLKNEVELWKKEKEELQLLRERNNILAVEEATAAARAAAAAYAVESPLSKNLGDVLDITSEATLTELAVLEYEKKLAKYQDEYSLSQAEKRYNTRWQLVANAYKQKLMEVERLCDEELEKVRQNASYLQPLKDIASQWYSDERNRGDSIQGSYLRIESQKYKSNNNNECDNYYNFRRIDAEMNKVPEMFAAKFQYEDLSKQDLNCGKM